MSFKKQKAPVMWERQRGELTMLQVSTDVRRSECVCCACGDCCVVAWRVQVAEKSVIKSPHLTSPPLSFTHQNKTQKCKSSFYYYNPL
jgi:hypothetical protein